MWAGQLAGTAVAEEGLRVLGDECCLVAVGTCGRWAGGCFFRGGIAGGRDGPDGSVLST